MSGPLGSQQWMYATETPFYPYTIDNSLRFDGSSYLRRLSATSSAIHQFTMSFWVKISDGGSSTSTPYHLMSFQNYTDSATAGICIYNDSITFFRQSSAYASFNPAKARDYSGWYHVVWKNKSDYYADIYINGVLIGTTSVQFEIINGSAISVGSGTSGNNPFAGGYIADVHFVSGSSLGPDSFGEYDSTGTIWKPKAFSGSHGTDGFHLDFADGTSATTLGYDVSGNSNNFTPSGIATSDQMLDSPTNNFATLNPLNAIASLSEGNLLAASTVQGWEIAHSTLAMSSGKWYCEYLIAAGIYGMGGISRTDNPYSQFFPGSSPTSYGYFSVSGDTYKDFSNSTYGAPYTVGDVVGIAFDADAGTLEFYKNNVSQGVAFTGITGEYYFGCAVYITSDVAKMNFGNDSSFSGSKPTGSANATDENDYGDFYYAPPTGYLALCSENLPDPTFDPRVGESPQDAFNVYTDTGANILSTAQSDYSDGLFWIKDYQNDLTDHQLLNTVTNTVLESNTTDAERAYSAPSGSSIAWAWKASTAFSGTTNLGKSYSGKSTEAAGVSVVTYTGAGTGHQIPHNLAAVPKFIVIKQRTPSGTGHITYHASQAAAPELGYLNLGTSNGYTPSSTIWADTAPTSSYVTLGASASVSSNTTYTMLAFAEKEGFSKFGSYEGNANADGSFVYLGFRPAFVMVKSTGTGSWYMIDSARDGYNVDNNYLLANTADAESTTDTIDLLSNGFKLRATTYNASSTTYIYMAFAEQPFKYSLAR